MFAIVLGVLFVVVGTAGNGGVPESGRDQDIVVHEHSVSVIVLLGFEFSNVLVVGILHSFIVWLSLRCSIFDRFLNVFPDLLIFPQLSPLRKPLRGHEPMHTVDGYTLPTWVVPEPRDADEDE
uniref:Secreted protein n=1 Tax=Chromera velia CCMP2878 TaxID=1169474 RepID=A0A0G4HNM9_9ALVE|eukprot:Cvel_29588.t1-p1 / transcript=Cvel_29588.t1 / gene=Cvel_29588 / organism=Chromera_velia_CCMP2878 / gene_product=hypothetical protein / transcript_product=hypothetical protein / location=Cvel_scaffold4075:9279-9985(+) / protein_length=122 / sequence_SO=supercontig / SO=protein_coding / is_pseudo=false